MSRPARRPRLTLALLCFGVLALVLNSLAGISHARASTAGGLIEVCTPQGLVKIDLATGLVAAQQPVSSSDDAQLRCCELCAPCSMPALGDGAAVQVLDVAYASFIAQAPPASFAVPVAHPELSPLVPRGPPALS